jgi:hypothetical protein
MRPKSLRLFWMIGVFLVISTPAVAGENPHFTIPLHAKISSSELCSGYLPINCADELPTVNVPPNTTITVFAFVYNFNRMSPSKSHSTAADGRSLEAPGTASRDR